MIHDISRGEHTGDARRRCLAIEPRFHADIPSLNVELIGEKFSVGRMANSNEYTMDINLTILVRMCILDLDASDPAVVSEHLAESVIPGQGYVPLVTGSGKKLILKDGLCPETCLLYTSDAADE